MPTGAAPAAARWQQPPWGSGGGSTAEGLARGGEGEGRSFGNSSDWIGSPGGGGPEGMAGLLEVLGGHWHWSGDCSHRDLITAWHASPAGSRPGHGPVTKIVSRRRGATAVFERPAGVAAARRAARARACVAAEGGVGGAGGRAVWWFNAIYCELAAFDAVKITAGRALSAALGYAQLTHGNNNDHEDDEEAGATLCGECVRQGATWLWGGKAARSAHRLERPCRSRTVSWWRRPVRRRLQDPCRAHAENLTK